jgi:protocadherin Fat 1/2/3
VHVIEESRYPPVITPLEVDILSYQDEFPGSVIGRIVASDQVRPVQRSRIGLEH